MKLWGRSDAMGFFRTNFLLTLEPDTVLCVFWGIRNQFFLSRFYLNSLCSRVLWTLQPEQNVAMHMAPGDELKAKAHTMCTHMERHIHSPH